MTALPLPAAARALSVSEATLRRWIRRGAPQARRGRRGRGHACLIDVAAITAWRGHHGPSPGLRVFASEIPELVAAAVDECFRAITGPHKRASAGVLAATWYVVTVRLLDRLHADLPGLQDVGELPEMIQRLRQIGHEMID